MNARLGVVVAGLLLTVQAMAHPVSLRARDVRTFQVLDSRTMAVTTWHRHQWRIELSSFCIDLEGAHTIGFRAGPIHGEIDQFGSVLTSMASCPIRKVSYIGREPPRSKAKPAAADSPAPEARP